MDFFLTLVWADLYRSESQEGAPRWASEPDTQDCFLLGNQRWAGNKNSGFSRPGLLPGKPDDLITSVRNPKEGPAQEVQGFSAWASPPVPQRLAARGLEVHRRHTEALLVEEPLRKSSPVQGGAPLAMELLRARFRAVQKVPCCRLSQTLAQGPYRPLGCSRQAP